MSTRSWGHSLTHSPHLDERNRDLSSDRVAKASRFEGLSILWHRGLNEGTCVSEAHLLFSERSHERLNKLARHSPRIVLTTVPMNTLRPLESHGEGSDHSDAPNSAGRDGMSSRAAACAAACGVSVSWVNAHALTFSLIRVIEGARATSSSSTSVMNRSQR